MAQGNCGICGRFIITKEGDMKGHCPKAIYDDYNGAWDHE